MQQALKFFDITFGMFIKADTFWLFRTTLIHLYSSKLNQTILCIGHTVEEKEEDIFFQSKFIYKHYKETNPSNKKSTTLKAGIGAHGLAKLGPIETDSICFLKEETASLTERINCPADMLLTFLWDKTPSGMSQSTGLVI